VSLASEHPISPRLNAVMAAGMAIKKRTLKPVATVIAIPCKTLITLCLIRFGVHGGDAAVRIFSGVNVSSPLYE
jgi:hypothetical protein